MLAITFVTGDYVSWSKPLPRQTTMVTGTIKEEEKRKEKSTSGGLEELSHTLFEKAISLDLTHNLKS